jgi:hypothetical protein
MAASNFLPARNPRTETDSTYQAPSVKDVEPGSYCSGTAAERPAVLLRTDRFDDCTAGRQKERLRLIEIAMVKSLSPGQVGEG